MPFRPPIPDSVSLPRVPPALLMATSSGGGDGGEGVDGSSSGGRSNSGCRPQCDPDGKWVPNPNGDLDSTVAWGKAVLPPPSQYAEEAEKDVADAEKASAAADSLGEEVPPGHPSPPR